MLLVIFYECGNISLETYDFQCDFCFFLGLVYGHTGHVRFLTCVEMTTSAVPPLLAGVHSRSDSANNNTRDPDVPSPQDLNKRRSSVATMTAALATRMLVISGGDGYEDFRTNVVNEAAGKDDSTNHLLLWQV